MVRHEVKYNSAGLRIVLPPRTRPSARYYVYNEWFLRALRLLDGMLALFVPRSRSRSRTVPERPARILVSNCADFGDIVLVLPALQALRRFFPQAHVGFLSSAKTAVVLAGTGLVDQHHVVGRRLLEIVKQDRGWRLIAELRRFATDRWRTARELRVARYDVALDFYLFPFPATPLLFMAGIPIRAGFVSGGFGPLLTHPVEPGIEPRSILDRPREVLAVLWPDRAKALGPLKPCYPGHPVSVALPFGEVPGPYWVVHMGTGASYKEWPEANWQILLKDLAERNIRLLLTGSGLRERERIERVMAELPRPNVRAFSDRPWPEFVAAVAGAERVICLDSAIAHVAAAFKVPTTALFTGAHDLREWGPTNEKCDVLVAPVGCVPCNRRDCVEMTCVRKLGVGDVVDNLRSITWSAHRS